jgi:GNAT superfamily N-acetyltransferase
MGENEVRELLRISTDQDLRRETWEASKSVGRAVEGTVRELVRLRNQLAREQGYENHYARSLSLQEIEAGELARIMGSLESATDAPFRELKRDIDTKLQLKFGVDAVMPWHLSGPFFHRATDIAGIDLDRYFEEEDLEDLTRRTFDALGLDVRGVISSSDLYEREGKNQHAFCARMGREYPYDVRVLANVRPDAYWMDAMLHEFGHAVYDRHVNPRLPYLLRTCAHANTTEAIALMMGALIDDPGWLAVGPDRRGHRRVVALRYHRTALKVVHRWGRPIYGAFAANNQELAGVAATFGAGRYPPPAWTFLKYGPSFLLAGPAPIARGLRASLVQDKGHPKDEHVFLWFLAVDARHQRTGIGRALLARVFEEAEAPVYLDTSNPANVPYYASFGFEEIGKAALPRGATMWFMRRP